MWSLLARLLARSSNINIRAFLLAVLCKGWPARLHLQGLHLHAHFPWPLLLGNTFLGLQHLSWARLACIPASLPGDHSGSLPVMSAES